MASKSRSGHLVVSVDIPRVVESDSAGLNQVIDLLNQHRCPATWSVEDPVGRAADQVRERISGVAHEIALLGEEKWLGKQASRSRMADMLGQKTLAARAAGLQISTLAFRKGTVSEHLDVLATNRIRIVRDAATVQENQQGSLSQKSVRHDLWQAPPVSHVTQPGSWWQTVRAKRSYVKKVAQGGGLHLCLDSSNVTNGHVESLDETLGDLLQPHRRQNLTLSTLADLAEHYAPTRITGPTRSILRRAA